MVSEHLFMMASVLDHLVGFVQSVRSCFGSLLMQVIGTFVRRPFRVIVLSLAIVAMSGIDLYLTILYITHSGMNESNPIARAMMEYQSPMILGVWKAATVFLSIGILMMIRKKRSAELGAWVGCIVMGMLMLHWVAFIDQNEEIDFEIAAAQNKNNADWVFIPGKSNSVVGEYSGVVTD